MKNQTNVIQFPKSQTPSPAPNRDVKPVPGPKAKPKQAKNSSLLFTAGSLFAIALATGVTNAAFLMNPSVVEERGLASAADTFDSRDAAWEKSVAESLASVEVREPASAAIGHKPNLDASVRYGALERKYTILRDLKRDEVESIVLQDKVSEPTLIKDRAEFLATYGKWVSGKYSFAELKSSEVNQGGRVESFALFDSKRRAYALVRFEMDSFQGLLALRLQPL